MNFLKYTSSKRYSGKLLQTVSHEEILSINNDISGSHRRVVEYTSLLKCDAVYLRK